MLSAWLRVIRLRFLLSSVIAVSVGLALAWRAGSIDATDAALTLGGVIALHASVDMLNDYWDWKRGIDAKTERTAMSGGTGVLPEGLLKPKDVYRAGMASLILGTAVGAFFVIMDGVVIAALLGFAVISIYFYSTRIVDSGLGEIFVAIKGACIVMGTYFIQTGDIATSSVACGAAVGILSSTVLLITSFPDHDADKSQGRRTLVVVWGKKRASQIFWAFPASASGIIISSVFLGVLPPAVLIALTTMPLAAWSGRALMRNYDRIKELVPVMGTAILYSRLTGALLVAGLILSMYIV